MIKMALLLASFTTAALASQSCDTILTNLVGPYPLSKEIVDLTKTSFIPKDSLAESQYISVDLDFSHISNLASNITRREGKTLLNRGEAHVTLINPVEVGILLKANITLEELNVMAAAKKIQLAPFSIECLGKGSKEIGSKIEDVFYLVVKSEAYLDFRREVANLFVMRGGDPTAFNPDFYFPHITVGFTLRDLYPKDGVIKDLSSCIEKIILK